MRALALSCFAALAISMMASAPVWAWTTEQVSPNGAAGTALAEQEDPIKALQDKVDGKNPAGQSGFYISGSAGQQPYSPFGFNSNRTTSTVPLGYPMTGYRGQ